MKNWWKSFFKPITAEVMFKPRQGKQTRAEVNQILKQIKQKESLNILDLCCGEGRHSIEFAKRKHHVAGLDYTQKFLNQARIEAKKQNLHIRFIKEDMKKTSEAFDKNSFDVVVSLYNSFGYFDKRSDDLKTLKEINKVLKLGGHIIINTLNGSSVKKSLSQPRSMGYEIEKNLFMIDKAFLDFKKMRTQSNWTIIDARKKKTSVFRGDFSQNVYTHKQMKNMLEKAGFKIVKTWGMLHGTPFNEKKSWHQTVMAKKVK